MYSRYKKFLLNLSNGMNFDKVCAISILVFNGYSLYESFITGRMDLKMSTDSDLNYYAASNTLLSEELVDKLSLNGILVADSCLSEKELDNISKELIDLITYRRFIATPNNDDTLRSDKVFFLRKSESMPDRINNGLFKAELLLRGMGNSLEANNFKGFLKTHPNLENSMPFLLSIPDQIQISLYPASGSFYKPHIDGVTKLTADQMGYREYLSNACYRARVITIILYLNNDPKWIPENGGCLRVYLNDGSYQDIEPIGGRMVIFDSKEIIHEVRPTFRDRFAATIWLTQKY